MSRHIRATVLILLSALLCKALTTLAVVSCYSILDSGLQYNLQRVVSFDGILELVPWLLSSVALSFLILDWAFTGSITSKPNQRSASAKRDTVKAKNDSAIPEVIATRSVTPGYAHTIASDSSQDSTSTNTETVDAGTVIARQERIAALLNRNGRESRSPNIPVSRFEATSRWLDNVQRPVGSLALSSPLPRAFVAPQVYGPTEPTLSVNFLDLPNLLEEIGEAFQEISKASREASNSPTSRITSSTSALHPPILSVIYGASAMDSTASSISPISLDKVVPETPRSGRFHWDRFSPMKEPLDNGGKNITPRRQRSDPVSSGDTLCPRKIKSSLPHSQFAETTLVEHEGAWGDPGRTNVRRDKEEGLSTVDSVEDM